MATVNQAAAAPDVMTGSDEAASGAAAPAPRRGLLAQPSTWSALWVLAAMFLLGALRPTLRRLA